MKPGLRQGRAALRWKIKLPLSPPINKPIVKLTEKTNSTHSKYGATKITLKIPISETLVSMKNYSITRLHNSSNKNHT